MDESNITDLDRAARRREQNRVAQRNHRRRKQSARQNSLQQHHHHQQPPQPQQQQRQESQEPQEPQQLLPSDWWTNRDDDDDGDEFAFEWQSWEENPTTATLPKEGSGVNNDYMGELQAELPHSFDSPVQERLSSNQHSAKIYPSPSLDIESPRVTSRTASKNHSLQSVPVNHESTTTNGSGRDSSSRRVRLPLPNTPSASSSLPLSDSLMLSMSSHSPAQPMMSNQSSQPRRESFARYPTKGNRLQQASSPESIDRGGEEELEQRSISGQARACSIQQQHRQQHEHDNYLTRTTRGKNRGITCLHLAAARGSCALVQYFLAQGMPPDTRDSEGLTALFHAIRGGHEDTVNELLLGGAGIEVTDSRGRTALHFAVEQMQDDIVILLIQRGANIHATVTRQIRQL